MSSIATRPILDHSRISQSRGGSKRSKNNPRKTFFGYGVIVALTAYIVCLLTPLVALAVTSVGFHWFGGWLPESLTFRWFSFATSASNVPSLIVNSLIIAGLCVVISMGIGIPAAWALARRRIRVRGLLFLLLLIPRMVPPIAVALGISKEFYNFGLIDTHLGVAIAHSILVIPLVILVMSSTFEGLDDYLLEAARVCGASGVQTLWQVIRPLAMPGLVVATIFAVVTSLNEFTLTLLTYGPTTITLTIQTYIEIDKGFREIASAISVFLLVPSLLFLVVIQRYIRPENLFGGLKGV